MITPKQAAEIAAQSASAESGSTSGLTTAIEVTLDARLVLHGRAALSCSASPPPGALVAAPPLIMEVERRYRAAGWVTKLDGGTVLIEAPSTPLAGVVSSRRNDSWRCRACGAANLTGGRCLVCRAART